MKIARLLIVAPFCDATDVGEAWVASQWVRHLAGRAEVTLLTQRRRGRTPTSAQLPDVEVIEFDEVALPARFERFNAMLKPGYPVFRHRAEQWIADALASGRSFDVAQQLTPIALRYASPLAAFDIPWVLGPLAGSLQTPAAFLDECSGAAWYTRLRGLDRWRLRYDTDLRRSYQRAALVLGVAPYVRDLLGHLPIQRFEVMSELGVDDLAPIRPRLDRPDRLRLVHVGRAVRTKGLRDAVRAMALLPRSLDVTLDVAGCGEDTEPCRAEAERLGIADRIRFLGRLPRAEVETLYARSDAFLFPSFREPSGSVVYEALRHGLPVITADRGGPGHVVDASCGFAISVETPNAFAAGLAEAIMRLAVDVPLRRALAQGAQRRISEIGLWPKKVDHLMALYAELIDDRARRGRDDPEQNPLALKEAS